MKTEAFPIRLNKYISHRSKYSRREADELIKSGQVKIDNKTVTDLATAVNAEDKVRVNNKYLNENFDEYYTVIAYNKPKGELVTKSDPQGRKTIYDTLESKYAHFLPVGRLDYASEGLLLLTDSSLVAEKIMTSVLERTYNIKIKGDIPDKIEKAMLEGLVIEDSIKGAHKSSRIDTINIEPFVGYKIKKNTQDYSKLTVIITEGKNRELRRFFAHFDREVVDLKRVNFGWIGLNALPTGKTRYLDKKEYQELKDFITGKGAKNVEKTFDKHKVQK
jgi:23S rRNA pseudouridine2605 synthase